MSQHSNESYPPRVCVVADDLTGAAEICALGVSLGFEARIRLWQENEQSWDMRGNTPMLLAIDTDSRSISAAEAASRVVKTTDMIAQIAPSFVYKKVDSILRGNVVHEILAMLHVLRREKCILVPCNPTLGRTIRNGMYFIGDKPIDQTQFKDDPTWPRTSPFVIHLLGRHASIATAGPTDVLPPVQIVVGEVSTYADVMQWAARVTDDCLPAGGSDFFRACMESTLQITAHRSDPLPSSVMLRPPPTISQTRDLFLCGSATETTRIFVERVRESGLPVITLPEKASSLELTASEIDELSVNLAQAMMKSNRVVLAVGLPRVWDPRHALKLVEWLVKTASKAIAYVQPHRIFAEGGATAVAFAREMNWNELHVLGELTRGVAVTQPIASYAPEFIIKPGSYPWPPSVLQ